MKKISSIIGSAAGLLSIIFSFVILSFDIGSTENNVAYGGDAYTGIQNAAAQTAVNVYSLNYMVRFGLFAILLIAGIVLLCHYIPALMGEMGSDALAKVKISTLAKGVQGNTDAKSEELKKYKDLLDSGVITPEEFSEKARELMGLGNAPGDDAEGGGRE